MNPPRHCLLRIFVIATACTTDDGSAGAETQGTTTSAVSSSSSTGLASTGSTGSGEPSTTAADTTAIATDDGDATAGLDTSSGAAAACDEPPADDPCLTCGHEQCAELYAGCCELTQIEGAGVQPSGCLPLVRCALATGCMHVTCYQPDTCMAEVDGAGGITGDGTAAAGALGECLLAAIDAGASAACSACQASLG